MASAKTTKQIVIEMDKKVAVMSQKIDDFIDNSKDDKNDHDKEHSLMWKLLIGIPSSLFLLFSIVIILMKVLKW